MRIRVPLAVSLLLLFGSLAQAQPVTFHFTATIYTSTGAAPISSGTVTGSYTFDAGWPYGPRAPTLGLDLLRLRNRNRRCRVCEHDGLLIAVYDAAWTSTPCFPRSARSPVSRVLAIRYVSIDLAGPNTISLGGLP